MPCEKPWNGCDADGVLRHTAFRHLYRLRLENPVDDGHDVLVIAFNPNCPDDTSSATFRYIERLAAHLGGRTVTVVNPVPRRSASPDLLDLRDVPAERLQLNRAVVERAVMDASVVVV